LELFVFARFHAREGQEAALAQPFLAPDLVALDLALLPEIFSRLVEQATDGPRKGLNPPPALR
jgi:hypothetical protein